MNTSIQQRVTSVQDLLSHYRSINPEKHLFVGIELEKSGVFRDTLKPVPFKGEKSYLSILERLEKEVGWEVTERDENAIYAMKRGDTQITTEADGRPELTGSPKIHLHDIAREYRLHERELREMGDVFNIAWLPLGLQPFVTNDDILYAPKKRYQVFLEVDQSSWMHTWLKRMNGIHVNLSVTTEENAIQKAQTLFRILPIISAMFASSPFSDGKTNGLLNNRRSTVYTNPPVRLDLPRNFLDADFSYEHWMQHIIDIPMILLYTTDGSAIRPSTPMTFADWMQNGYEGQFPTIGDFDQQVKTVWSDIRLRPSYLEYRVADSLPSALALSVPALLKGLVFDSSSWKAVADLTHSWSYDDILRIDRESWRTGLQTLVHGKKLLSYAQELITIADEKLQGFKRTDAANEDESIYLDPIKEQISLKGKSPAEELVDLYDHAWNSDLRHLVSWCDAQPS